MSSISLKNGYFKDERRASQHDLQRQSSWLSADQIIQVT